MKDSLHGLVIEDCSQIIEESLWAFSCCRILTRITLLLILIVFLEAKKNGCHSGYELFMSKDVVGGREFSMIL